MDIQCRSRLFYQRAGSAQGEDIHPRSFPGPLTTVTKLAAWRGITSLPHALESTLAFLVVILQDKGDVGSSISVYSLRQGYATAVIRFVNGLVDPLQSGPYARSIGSIAAQIGLPSWFVELRHAATHEDLPSLEVLREATSEVRCELFCKCLSCVDVL